MTISAELRPEAGVDLATVDGAPADGAPVDGAPADRAPADRAPAARSGLTRMIHDAVFRQAWKGYDTAQVDDFLDEVMAAVEGLEGRLAETEERLDIALESAVRAEQRSARADGDDAIRRTLVLAQRAADLVVSEARSVADRIVAEAREKAAQRAADAEQVAAELIAAARAEARTITAQADITAERRAAQRAAEIQAELASVVEDRTRRQAEVDELVARLEELRHQQRSFLEEQLRLLG